MSNFLTRRAILVTAPSKCQNLKTCVTTRRTFTSSPTTARSVIPELDLSSKVIIVTGAARGLGLCMAQALLESGATVYALDRLLDDQRSPAFKQIESQAKREWGTQLHYKQIDTRDVPRLNTVIERIADQSGRIDGLIGAAGIQQETPALAYSADDANGMFEV